jgi:hypothetical protein
MTSGENMWAATYGDFSKLQGDLNFAFDQRESKVNLHKATSSYLSVFYSLNGSVLSICKYSEV